MTMLANPPKPIDILPRNTAAFGNKIGNIEKAPQRIFGVRLQPAIGGGGNAYTIRVSAEKGK